MFNKSFTCKVTTDANGKFEVTAPVEGSGMFAVHVNIQATIQSPANTKLTGTFAIAPAAARSFSGTTNETVALGKWQVARGSNTAVAAGATSPARANTEIVVQFDANL